MLIGRFKVSEIVAEYPVSRITPEYAHDFELLSAKGKCGNRHLDPDAGDESLVGQIAVAWNIRILSEHQVVLE